MAYEVIENRSVSEIRLATLQVFQADGYQVKSAFGRDLVFEKPASMLSSMTFGSWMDPEVWLRVKVRIEEVRTGVNVIQCNVYRVQDRGDTVLEEESRAYEKRKAPFRGLLAKVKAKLDALPRSCIASHARPA